MGRKVLIGMLVLDRSGYGEQSVNRNASVRQVCLLGLCSSAIFLRSD